MQYYRANSKHTHESTQIAGWDILGHLAASHSLHIATKHLPEAAISQVRLGRRLLFSNAREARSKICGNVI